MLARMSEIRVAGPFHRLRFTAPDLAPALDPGRALLVESPRAYARRAVWPCRIDERGFEVLADPAQWAWLRSGDDVDVLGPVGRGFRVDAAARNLLLVASGARAPDPDLGPLLALVDRALAEGRSVTVAFVAAASEETYPVSELPPAIEVIRAVDASLFDRLTDAVAWADQVFACGSGEFVERLADCIDAIRFPAPRDFAQVLRPLPLPCGVGACGACWLGWRRACVDGPVFELKVRPSTSVRERRLP